MKPTELGWYWWRQEECGRWEAVYLDTNLRGRLIVRLNGWECDELLDSMMGGFGPRIPDPPEDWSSMVMTWSEKHGDD